MAFENISKGEFTTSIGGEFVVRKTGNGGVPIVQTFNKMEEDFENFEPNAEFIAFCFNLQQRYDISKLEEAIELLEEVDKHEFLNVFRREQIKKLLKQINNMTFYKPIVCYGQYYNFKNGFEQCAKKCNLFNENASHLVVNCNYSSVLFRNIKEFRNCKNKQNDTVNTTIKD